MIRCSIAASTKKYSQRKIQRKVIRPPLALRSFMVHPAILGWNLHRL